jgi:hypothetical protein
MKRGFPVEFVYQLFSLLIAFILVHALYVSIIRPQANAFIAQEALQMQSDPAYIQQRSFFVVIKDYEQETCFILMLWAFAILGFKGRTAYRQQQLLGQDLLRLPAELPIGLEDTRDLAGRIQSLPASMQDYLLPRALLTAIERFAATRNVQNVSTAARDICDSEGDRMESELSIIRYIAWAIPSVGFNSTFIALVISIVLMLFIHQLQLMQERLVLDSERYVDHWLIRRLQS